jgi:hypothetical protein
MRERREERGALVPGKAPELHRSYCRVLYYFNSFDVYEETVQKRIAAKQLLGEENNLPEPV